MSTLSGHRVVLCRLPRTTWSWLEFWSTERPRAYGPNCSESWMMNTWLNESLTFSDFLRLQHAVFRATHATGCQLHSSPWLSGCAFDSMKQAALAPPSRLRQLPAAFFKDPSKCRKNERNWTCTYVLLTTCVCLRNMHSQSIFIAFMFILWVSFSSRRTIGGRARASAERICSPTLQSRTTLLPGRILQGLLGTKPRISAVEKHAKLCLHTISWTGTSVFWHLSTLQKESSHKHPLSESKTSQFGPGLKAGRNTSPAIPHIASGQEWEETGSKHITIGPNAL